MSGFLKILSFCKRILPIRRESFTILLFLTILIIIQFAELVGRNTIVLPKNRMKMFYSHKSHLESYFLACQTSFKKEFFTTSQF